MAQFDLPLEELVNYSPERIEPPDFDDFWRQSLDEAREQRGPTVLHPVESDLRTLEALDVRFSGYGGQPIRAWLLLPAHRSEPLPTIVEFLGYGGGRGSPLDWLVWASAGYAHFVMDTRGQGSSWLAGDTPDVEPAGSNPQYPGFLTRGILDPRTYYYRRVFVDATMALDAAREHPSVDPARVVVAGTSYFDGRHFAARASAPALFAVGLEDQVTPPSTVFAAFNAYAGPKQIKVWPYSGHDASEHEHLVEQFHFLDGLGLRTGEQRKLV